MMLKNIPTEELLAEVSRRRELAQEAPKMVGIPDYKSIEHQIKDYMEYLGQNLREPKDGRYYIYEIAITAFYGKDVWDWINNIDGAE